MPEREGEGESAGLSRRQVVAWRGSVGLVVGLPILLGLLASGVANRTPYVPLGLALAIVGGWALVAGWRRELRLSLLLALLSVQSAAFGAALALDPRPMGAGLRSLDLLFLHWLLLRSPLVWVGALLLAVGAVLAIRRETREQEPR